MGHDPVIINVEEGAENVIEVADNVVEGTTEEETLVFETADYYLSIMNFLSGKLQGV